MMMIYCSGFALRYFLAVSALLLSSSNPFAPTNENEKMSKDIFFVFMPVALRCGVDGVEGRGLHPYQRVKRGDIHKNLIGYRHHPF